MRCLNLEPRADKNGKGLVNIIIDSLQFEAHLLGYQFCESGTRFEKR